MSSTQYQNLDEISHVLHRPDTYIGSTVVENMDEYVSCKLDGTISIERKKLEISPAMLRLFVEPLSNAIDNATRSKDTSEKTTKIKVFICVNSGRVSIWNDGGYIPIVTSEQDEDMYIHTMCFGKLRSGSNYNDDEERDVSGRNGLGVKCTNIYSSSFTVCGVDPINKLSLTQTWTENMRKTSGPVIKKSKLAKGYTEVSWLLDFEKLGVASYTDDVVDLFRRYVVDASWLAGVKVYFNNDLINVPTLDKYSKLYASPNQIDRISMTFPEVKAYIVITPSFGEFEDISFVNGVFTKDGGKHVENWSKAIFSPLADKFKVKKGTSISIKDLKQFFRIFVSVTVDKPRFDSQDKRELKGPNVKVVEVPKKIIDKIKKWQVAEQIQDFIIRKSSQNTKKTEKKTKAINIDGYETASNAGGKKSDKCTLFICEGLSAKAYAIAGLQTGIDGLKGRDWFGVLPLRGKMLNVRKATSAEIDNNRVITQLKQAIGLKQGVDYTIEENFKTLRYGKVSALCDADCDGIHIEGLLLNFFEHLFPSLFKREIPFLVSMKTPIVRLKSNKKDILFFDQRKFIKHIETNEGKIQNAKYYKGLATTSACDVPDTFGVKMINFVLDENAHENMQKVFSDGKLNNTKFTDVRKQWIADYSPEKSLFSLDDQGQISNMNITEFIDEELIKFSFDDCGRSLPCVIDGLKESQRKVLYAVMLRNLKYTGKSVKVAQMGSYAAEHTNYHHGEGNLSDVIKKMALEYPGTNNIPLFYRDGQFGTRLEGGEDGGAPRYIFTKFEELTEYIFRKEDTPLLNQIEEDGEKVQPLYYIPIIPMILVNGCQGGIGTGWSCSVPCYNPLDIVNCIREWLDKTDDDNQEVEFIELIPWYRGFKGTIEKDVDNNRYTSKGVCVDGKKKNEHIVTELPVGKWNNKFRENCLKHIKNGILEDYVEKSTITDVNILLKSPKGTEFNKEDIKLYTHITTTNMVLFNSDNKIVKYNSTSDILNEFCRIRLVYYVKRKEHLLDTANKELCVLSNKKRFIKEVIEKTISVMNTKEEDVIQQFKDTLYDEDPYESDSSKQYDYLLRMQMRTFTQEKILKLEQETESLSKQIKQLTDTTEKDMWRTELTEFENKYSTFLIHMTETKTKQKQK